MTRIRILAAGLLLACACDSEQPDLGPMPYPLLSDYRFFDGPLKDLKPRDGILEYTVTAPLFADNARKGRYIVLPEGKTMTLTDQDEWKFPVGAIVVKTFYFDTDRRDGPKPDDTRIMETRLLRFADDGLHSHIYRWNEEQTDAEYIRAGDDEIVEYTDADGNKQMQDYIIPDENACKECHERDDVLRVLGITTHQLNRTRLGGSENQLTWLADQGALKGVTDPSTLPKLADPEGDADVESRARAYLHGNCSHCHRPGGGGGSSSLKFSVWVDDPAQFGVCKVPAAAGPGAGGDDYDIVPGSPDKSIVVYRMASTDPEIKMPEIPSLLSDDFGVNLISQWIMGMDPVVCNGNDQ